MRSFVCLLLAAGLTAPAAGAASAATAVYGTVGPGYTITLKTAAGTRVKTLPRGLVVFHISDRSLDHDFHLTGGGVDRATEVAQKGSFTWRVKLKTGRYTYKCDPHEIIMIVTSASSETPHPVRPAPSI
jgi:plastocyanin